eukprot:NODE_1330_length_1549_cov_21.690577_g1258_i0.p1 GENE.NODE_1330_length_1549_cov_21.690577_g1258_i0~~NODE_1330_length_1549_cov_21.690577_g1258_i0.p1  ORF type:complete len:509 (-),score=130.35 NODE_1330_length_1549_cov_21.690577_g1258_i0:22-1503(-)
MEAILTDIRSAVQFEEELQYAWKEDGIVVADIYSSVWGPCSAIQHTFHRLYLEADTPTRLRFLTVSADSVLDELEGKVSGRRERQRLNNADDLPDTLPGCWQPVLEQCRERAMPLFMFWKEGCLVQKIEGVNTPLLCEVVKELSAVHTPASDHLTNSHLLELWNEHFSPTLSEVKWEHFLAALQSICKLTVPLTMEEVVLLRKRLNVDPTQRIVSAQELQAWVGPGTVMQAFTVLVPGYEDRAIQVRIEEEAEAKRLKKQTESERAPPPATGQDTAAISIADQPTDATPAPPPATEQDTAAISIADLPADATPAPPPATGQDTAAISIADLPTDATPAPPPATEQDTAAISIADLPTDATPAPPPATEQDTAAISIADLPADATPAPPPATEQDTAAISIADLPTDATPAPPPATEQDTAAISIADLPTDATPAPPPATGQDTAAISIADQPTDATPAPPPATGQDTAAISIADLPTDATPYPRLPSTQSPSV